MCSVSVKPKISLYTEGFWFADGEIRICKDTVYKFPARIQFIDFINPLKMVESATDPHQFGSQLRAEFFGKKPLDTLGNIHT